jgi:hypothetical protein
MSVGEELNREGRLLTTTDPSALWRRLLAEVRWVIEHWGPSLRTPETSIWGQPPSLSWGIWRGSLDEQEAFDDRELPVNTTIELIGQALVSVFRYLLVLHIPEVWAVKHQRLSTWLDELASMGAGQSRRSVKCSYAHALATPRRGWLSCQPTVAWVLTPLRSTPTVSR